MTEILDRTAYQRPGSFSEATGRMSKNMNYFKINYVLFTAAVLAAFILYNPTSLIILSIVGAAWTYVYLVRTEPLKIGERPVSEREKLLGERDLPGVRRRAAVQRRAPRREGAGRPVHR